MHAADPTAALWISVRDLHLRIDGREGSSIFQGRSVPADLFAPEMIDNCREYNRDM
jgi:hypothetical protein